MENGQDTENIDFINEFFANVHDSINEENLFYGFTDAIRKLMAAKDLNNFTYFIDAVDKAFVFKLPLPPGLITEKMKIFLQQFFADYKESGDLPHMSACYNNLKEIDSIDVVKLYSWVTNQINDTIRAKLSEFSDLENRIETAGQEISKKIKYVGLSGFAQHYGDIMKKEKIAKNLWLLLVIALGLVLLTCIGFSLYSFLTSDFDLSKTIFKTIYTVLLILIFLWTCRQYAFSKRQFLIYRHLASAISSYSLIDKSLSPNDADLKKALLCEVAKTIFPIPDGKVADSQQIPLMQILDLAKSATNKGQDKPA